MCAKKIARTGLRDDPVADDPAWIARIRRAVLSWGTQEGRELPWRGERDPYKVLVAELMLVQTTVAAVKPFYARFLARFPTVQDLAGAEESEVLKAWEGLGYYRRARQLHAAAKSIVAQHNGIFPEDPQAILALPGVGRYVAGAIRSFALGQRAAIVEANTQRLLSRWLAWPEDLKTTRSQTRLWSLADQLVPETEPGVFNQAFMDLGATVCLPRAPLCLLCPVSADCQSRQLGQQEIIPRISPRPAPLLVEEACALVIEDGRWLVVQRGSGGLWDGFWEFPTVHIRGVDPGGRSSGEVTSLKSGVLRLTGIAIEVGPEIHSVKFAVTKHQVTMHAFSARSIGGELSPGGGLVDAAWVSLEDLRKLTFGAAGRRLLTWLEKCKTPEWLPQ